MLTVKVSTSILEGEIQNKEDKNKNKPLQELGGRQTSLPSELPASPRACSWSSDATWQRSSPLGPKRRLGDSHLVGHDSQLVQRTEAEAHGGLSSIGFLMQKTRATKTANLLEPSLTLRSWRLHRFVHALHLGLSGQADSDSFCTHGSTQNSVRPSASR